MKVLLAFHQMQEWAGIIAHAEDLAAGLQELGHDVDALCAWRKNPTQESRKPACGPGHLGMRFDGGGYRWNDRRIHALNPAEWHAAVRGYDLIIWCCAVPPKAGVGSTDPGPWPWRDLYDVEVPQIAVIHDGSTTRYRAWFMDVADKFRVAVCVHPCGMNDLSALTLPRVFIPNPLPPRVPDDIFYNERQPGYLSHQSWRPEKRIYDLVRAARHISPQVRQVIAGDGSERRYAFSKAKTPRHWRADSQRLVDVVPHVELPGWISPEERDRLLTTLTAQVDPAWGPMRRAPGGQFNRATLEGMRCGAIPVGHVRALGDEFLVPGEHYVPLPQPKHDGFFAVPSNDPRDIKTEDYAATVEAAAGMSAKDAQAMRQNVAKLLNYFDRQWVAEQYINAARGHRAGINL